MLGIDVGKSTLAVCWLRGVEAGQRTELAREFPNTPVGHQALHRWLSKQQAGQVQVCMEATGPYTLSLALFLHEQGYPVSIVNPRRIKAYAQSRLSRVKNDRVDARLIAQFACSEVLPVWTPPTAERSSLRALQARVDQLERIMQQQRQVLESVQEQRVRESVERVCQRLAEEVQTMQREVQAHLEAQDELRAEVELLRGIPGIGWLTATRLVAAVDMTRFQSADSFAAFLGLTPQEHSSGTSVRGRSHVSKLGSKSLRTALYFPAMQACRFNPQVKALYQRLLAAGKPKKSALCAGMRKLAHQVYGVLKSGQPYDPTLGLPS